MLFNLELVLIRISKCSLLEYSSQYCNLKITKRHLHQNANLLVNDNNNKLANCIFTAYAYKSLRNHCFPVFFFISFCFCLLKRILTE